MRIKIIDIGNSKGVRLPTAVIKQYKFAEEVNLELHEDGIVLTPTIKPREGWSEKFSKSDIKLSKEDEKWLEAKNRFDEEDWKW
jgi:antitoxin MazE